MVARAQLLEIGIDRNAVDRRVKSGWLRTIHRGVYLVGPIEPSLAKVMAASLACGPSAVVSHHSAASLWGMIPDAASSSVVDVIVRTGMRRRPGARIRRVRTLRGDEVTTLRNIPVTTPVRTLLDLAPIAAPRELERALAEAFALRLIRTGEVEAMLVRHARPSGSRALAALLDAGQPARTRSEAEERLLASIDKARLPRPRTNTKLAAHRVDFFWARERLVVEVDGFTFHSSRQSFERDRRRDADLEAAGVRVMRVTWRQLENEPEAVLVRIAQALAQAPR